MGLFDHLREGVGLQRPLEPQAVPEDEQAIARYRYMLRTAPPETIEQAHAEAFAKLSPAQRQRVLQELSDRATPAERAAMAGTPESPAELARAATRAELREPGTLERILGGVRPSSATAAPAAGGLFGSTLLGSMAGGVLGSMIAQHFFSAHPDASHTRGDAADEASIDPRPADEGDASVWQDDTFSGEDVDTDSDFGDTFDA